MLIDLTKNQYFLFGKLNNSKNIIVPNKDKLERVQILNNGNNLINPIAKYFLDKLFQDFNKASLSGKFSKQNTKLYPLTISSAGANVYSKYENYISTIFDEFIKINVANNNIENMLSFEDIVFNFTKFLFTLENGPYTLSAYTLSRYNNLNSSGLVVNLFDGVKNDVTKDVNYNLYISIVNKNGFLIDKNNLGRLILNLRHESVVNRMRELGINSLSDFYSTYFVESSTLDIKLMSFIILKKYNEFCIRYPIAKPKSTCYNTKVTQDYIQRNLVSFNVLFQKYDYLYWFKIYLFLRGLETYKSWSQNEFDLHIIDLSNIYKTSLDNQYDSTLNYVLKLVGRYPYTSVVGNTNFYYEPRL